MAGGTVLVEWSEFSENSRCGLSRSLRCFSTEVNTRGLGSQTRECASDLPTVVVQPDEKESTLKGADFIQTLMMSESVPAWKTKAKRMRNRKSQRKFKQLHTLETKQPRWKELGGRKEWWRERTESRGEENLRENNAQREASGAEGVRAVTS